ncbi:hypothetical protein AAMO2058_001054000 [Amorphochlora amoebiformis]|mmetsp:Transcript_11083/g.17525  ORF Transcript_11083/g.17525 Transcript_11083/m.17525 type:complete len:132 (-) Transcript_11083:170-565(-)
MSSLLKTHLKRFKARAHKSGDSSQSDKNEAKQRKVKSARTTVSNAQKNNKRASATRVVRSQIKRIKRLKKKDGSDHLLDNIELLKAEANDEITIKTKEIVAQIIEEEMNAKGRRRSGLWKKSDTSHQLSFR